MADFTMDRFSLKGKTALVTGAERGIGLEIAKGLAAAGANIIIAGLMEEEFPKAEAAVRAKGVSCTVLKADISKEEDVLRLAEQAWEIFPNGLDILVNNAGVNKLAPAGGDAAGGLAEGRRCQSNGHVPHVSHVRKPDAAAGTRQYCERCVHVRSGRQSPAPAAMRVQLVQGGCHHADKVHGQRMAQRGVRVNAICPGFTDTPLTARRLSTPNDPVVAKWIGGTPMGRVAQPDEMVGLVLYFASDASTFTTGAVLSVDGGYTCL